MRTKSPRANIPSFDNLYCAVFDFIKENQGEKGFIKTDSMTDDLVLDTIYGIRYNNESCIGEEVIVFGVRVNNDDIEVITKPYMKTYHNAPTDKEYADSRNWRSLKWDDEVYYIETLLNIAEYIEEYV